jgi:hypothetical protein
MADSDCSALIQLETPMLLNRVTRHGLIVLFVQEFESLTEDVQRGIQEVLQFYPDLNTLFALTQNQWIRVFQQLQLFDSKARHTREDMQSKSDLQGQKRYSLREKRLVKNDYLEMLEEYARQQPSLNALAGSIRNNINAQNRVWKAMEIEHMVLRTEEIDEPTDITTTNINFDTIDINSCDERYRCVVMT